MTAAYKCTREKCPWIKDGAVRTTVWCCVKNCVDRTSPEGDRNCVIISGGTEPGVMIENGKVYFCGIDITDNVQSYRIEDGKIYLSLMFFSGNMSVEGKP